MTNVPPMTSVQNVLWTSTSLTNRCTCANVMPTPLKGARSARAAAGVRSESRRTPAKRRDGCFMLFIASASSERLLACARVRAVRRLSVAEPYVTQSSAK